MNNIEKREKLHQILDLVLDVNGFEQRDVEITGDKPTVFFSFSGHVCAINLRGYKKGYDSSDIEYDFYKDIYLDKDCLNVGENSENLDDMIKYLEGLKNGTHTEL